MRDDPFAQLGGLDQKLFSTQATAKREEPLQACRREGHEQPP